MSQIKKNKMPPLFYHSSGYTDFICPVLDLPAAVLVVYLPAPVSSHIAEGSQVLLL